MIFDLCLGFVFRLWLQSFFLLDYLVGSRWQGPWPKFRGSCFEIWLWKYIKFDYFWHCVSPKSLGNLFMDHLWSKALGHLGWKINHSVYHWMQILYWFENSKESVFENEYLSQYVAGLPSEISSFLKWEKDMTDLTGHHQSNCNAQYLYINIYTYILYYILYNIYIYIY